jgi:hypothetical protein
MRVLVCGNRQWTDYELIYTRLSKLPEGTIVIHGGARGADALAGIAAKVLGLDVDCNPAEWQRYSKAAGPIRNRTMLDMKPDLVIAFNDPRVNSCGTRNMVHQAKRRHVPIEIINPTDTF